MIMNFSALESRQSKILLGLAALSIVIGIVMIFLQVSNLRALKVEVEDEKLALAQAEALLKQRLEYQANAPFYREKARKLQQMIPTQPQEDDLLRLINRTVEEYDLRVHEIRFEARAPNAEQGYVRMPLVITIEGNFRNMIALLDYLQWSERAFRIDEIRIALITSPQSGIRTIIHANAFYRVSE